MSERLPSSRSLPAEPQQVGRADLPGPPDQSPTTDCEHSDDTAIGREDAARLAADTQLRDVLAGQGFSGPAYATFEEELVSYARPLMVAWLMSGEIFVRCTRAGIGLSRQRLGQLDCEDLADTTIARGLVVFKQKALVESRWNPERGASLTTSFVNFLPMQFANVYRVWFNRQKAQDLIRYEDVPDTVRCPRPQPDEIVLQREQIREGLCSIRERTGIALVLTEDGYDQAEIAEILGTTPRAVEGLLHRHRNTIEASRDQEKG